MLEMLLNPKKAERKPWELFFVGAFYSSISFFGVNWIFGSDPVLSQYVGVLIVMFTVMFSMPFIYYTIRLEEKRVNDRRGTIALLKTHKQALYAFMWLFMGFLVALSFWYILLNPTNSFKAQIETYCSINENSNFKNCINQYGITNSSSITGGDISSGQQLLVIFSNNLYVLLLTLLFSLVLGAGAIFILVWNASVIAAAVGIFSRSKLSDLPLGLARYMIHGIPEIASYFIVALAGGMVSVAVIKHETGTEKFWEVLQDSLNLIILALVVLFIAALIEVYVTPVLF